MVVFKNRADTLEGVLKHQKHASKDNLQLKSGEIILIQQTVSTLLYSSQKTIRWAMDYVRTYEDLENESERIFGRHWNYIIQCDNLRPIEGFNMSDIQVSNHNYKPAMRYAYVRGDDEQEILDWIQDIQPIENEMWTWQKSLVYEMPTISIKLLKP